MKSNPFFAIIFIGCVCNWTWSAASALFWQGSHQCVSRWSVWRRPGTSSGPPSPVLWASRSSVSPSSVLVLLFRWLPLIPSPPPSRSVARRLRRYRHQCSMPVQRQEPSRQRGRLWEGPPLLVPLFTVQGRMFVLGSRIISLSDLNKDVFSAGSQPCLRRP